MRCYATAASTAALVLLTVAVFGPSLVGGGWVLDDHRILETHAHHGDVLGEWTSETFGFASGQRGSTWTPIPATLQHTLALVWGRESATPVRLLNLLVHTLNVVLVAAVARRLGAGPVAAFVAGAVAAVHPVGPPSVCVGTVLPEMMPALFGLVGLRWVPDLPARGQVATTFVITLLACLCKSNGILVFVPLVLVTRRWQVGAAGLAAVAVYLLWLGRVLPSFVDAASGGSIGYRVWCWLQTSTLPFGPRWSPLSHPVAGGFPGVWPGVLVVVAGAAAAWAGQRRLAEGVATWLLVSIPSGMVIIATNQVLSFRYAYGALYLALPFLAAGTGRVGKAVTALLAVGALGWTLPTASWAAAFRDDGTLLDAVYAMDPNPGIEIGRFHQAAMTGQPVTPEQTARVWALYTSPDPALAGMGSRIDVALLARVALQQGDLVVAEGAARAALTRNNPNAVQDAGCTLATVLLQQRRPAEVGVGCR